MKTKTSEDMLAADADESEGCVRHGYTKLEDEYEDRYPWLRNKLILSFLNTRNTEQVLSLPVYLQTLDPKSMFASCAFCGPWSVELQWSKLRFLEA